MSKGNASIRAYKIKNEYELIFLAGFMWDTDGATEMSFKNQKKYDIGSPEPSNILLDFVDETNSEILETITIPEKRYLELTRNDRF